MTVVVVVVVSKTITQMCGRGKSKREGRKGFVRWPCSPSSSLFARMPRPGCRACVSVCRCAFAAVTAVSSSRAPKGPFARHQTRLVPRIQVFRRYTHSLSPAPATPTATPTFTAQPSTRRLLLVKLTCPLGGKRVCRPYCGGLFSPNVGFFTVEQRVLEKASRYRQLASELKLSEKSLYG